MSAADQDRFDRDQADAVEWNNRVRKAYIDGYDDGFADGQQEILNKISDDGK
jgi:hypothetical protein